MSVALHSNVDLTVASRQGAFSVGNRRLITVRSKPPQRRQGLSFSAFGVGFSISATCDKLLRDCLSYLPCRAETVSKCNQAVSFVTYRLKASTGTRSTFTLTKDSREVARCCDRTEFLERFGSIVALHVADNSRERIFMHAGAVGWGDRAIVIPGRSFSGKTTLVADLVRAGATYYSDEFAVVDPQGRVHPYAQPLQLRDSGTYRQTRCPVERLGGLAGEAPLPVGLVVFSQYNPESTWVPQELSPGIGCLQMLDNTISARSAPEIAVGTLKQVASSAVMVKGLRGDGSQVIQWIIAQFGPLASC